MSWGSTLPADTIRCSSSQECPSHLQNAGGPTGRFASASRRVLLAAQNFFKMFKPSLKYENEIYNLGTKCSLQRCLIHFWVFLHQHIRTRGHQPALQQQFTNWSKERATTFRLYAAGNPARKSFFIFENSVGNGCKRSPLNEEDDDYLTWCRPPKFLGSKNPMSGVGDSGLACSNSFRVMLSPVSRLFTFSIPARSRCSVSYR